MRRRLALCSHLLQRHVRLGKSRLDVHQLAVSLCCTLRTALQAGVRVDKLRVQRPHASGVALRALCSLQRCLQLRLQAAACLLRTLQPRLRLQGLENFENNYAKCGQALNCPSEPCQASFIASFAAGAKSRDKCTAWMLNRLHLFEDLHTPECLTRRSSKQSSLAALTASYRS